MKIFKTLLLCTVFLSPLYAAEYDDVYQKTIKMVPANKVENIELANFMDLVFELTEAPGISRRNPKYTADNEEHYYIKIDSKDRLPIIKHGFSLKEKDPFHWKFICDNVAEAMSRMMKISAQSTVTPRQKQIGLAITKYAEKYDWFNTEVFWTDSDYENDEE